MTDSRATTEHEELLRSLAEQLKLPLLQISQAVELARLGKQTDLQHIEVVADMALRLVDSYVLSSQLSVGQTQLQMEPVSVASVLHETVENLDKIAKEYECKIELDIGGKYVPVMADKLSLESALTSLGYSFIEAQAQTGVKNSRLVLAAHKSSKGIVAGVYGSHEELTSDMFERAKLMQGRARQPLPPLGHMPSAGIFIAQSLLSNISSGLRVSRHSNLKGLAATLMPSPQLRLVS